MVKRTQIEAEKTRSAIVAAAKMRFESEGYAGASLASITSDAGITKGALFHYFQNKEHLFREVWTDLQLAMDKEARKAAAMAADPEDPFAAFLAGCRTYLKWTQRTDYQQIVLVDGPAVLGMAGWYEQDNDLGSDNVTKGVAYLSKCGFVEPSEVQSLAVMYQNMLIGSGFALSRKQEGVTAKKLFASFERLLRSLDTRT